MKTSVLSAVMASGLTVTDSVFSAEAEKQDTSPPNKGPIPEKKVFDFVNAAHFKLEPIQRMLKETPALANACVDWGGGDFESALGAASHMGRRDIAAVLLDHGARKNIFYAAMSGDKKVVTAFVSGDSSIVKVRGPHWLTLMYHAVFSKDLELVTYLKENGAAIGDADLQPAIWANSYEMAEWLLDNGVIYDGKPAPFADNKDWATYAREQGKERIAKLLESRK